MNDLLELVNLTKTYQTRNVAISNMSLRLSGGKIVGLLGPNGSGKTTLIKMLNGLLVPTQGSVRINGRAPGVETKAQVAYLPDKTFLNNSWRVSELLAYYHDFYLDFRKEKALEMLTSLNIRPSDRMKTLSKGTKEKVQLILVMSRAAQLYILDEPIAGVDPAARDYILRTIISNYSPEATVLLATHLIGDIEQVLDEVIFLRQGQLLLHDSVDTIRKQHGKSVDAYFREVFAC
ncbi:MAG: ABC transporter ATP-binding protein [Clostridium sp.]|jgi:ABC-2 type transport system ATP-binding protein|nr:ABC transporter ATP-binding protein [Clostridium sp.]